MNGKHLNILIVPQKKGGIISFELSLFRLKALILALVVVFLVSLVMVTDYVLVVNKGQKQKKLEKDILLQQLKIQEINNRLSTIRLHLKKFEEFDAKLRLISGLQKSNSRIKYLGKTNISAAEDYNFDSYRILDNLKKLDIEIKLREISFFQLDSYLDERKDKLARTPSVAPTKGYISSRFGERRDPFTGKMKFHYGLDFSNQPYTPIYAPADGVVVNTMVNGDFGEFLVIDHGYNIVTRYGHLTKYEVRVGQKVRRGDLIARMGNTGRSTAPHLHYEVLIDDQYENPEKFILH